MKKHTIQTGYDYRTGKPVTETVNLNPGKAIRYFCMNCVGYENIREEIKRCSSKNCPLYPYRGFVITQDLSEQERERRATIARNNFLTG